MEQITEDAVVFVDRDLRSFADEPEETLLAVETISGREDLGRTCFIDLIETYLMNCDSIAR